ncbi:MAG: 50S ribosomal protein L19e [Candidatus Diapherotrites archaeon]|nr:50S ribosomal protein L19e [Candidatus Diapherotrites archaeon]
MKVDRAIELVASMYGVGKERVWVDPDRIEEVASALTKDDLRRLIEFGVIKILQKKGYSRVRARELKLKKKKGRRRGPGSRKGTPGARLDPKKAWITKIRAIRRLLKRLREKGVIDRKTYRKLYRQAKGGFIRSKAHVIELIEGR